METSTKSNIETKLEFVVKETDILDEIGLLEGIEQFDEEKYQQLNREGNYNATMLPHATMVMLPEKIHDKVFNYAYNNVDWWSDCDAVYDDVADHLVRCSLKQGHEGLHVNIGCSDVNAIWR